MKGFNLLMAILIIFLVAYSVFSQINTSIVEKCKVVDLQQQQLINGSNGSMRTEIRYLVITDKETFVVESSWLNGKFNNSDIYFRLKKDSTYNFKVAGLGKSMITEYRNILEVIK